MIAKTAFWAIYHLCLIIAMAVWSLTSNTSGVCFCGFLLLYTQQWWIADRMEEGGE